MTSQSLLMKANEKEEDMRYLSFDIECCDGHHICEFGYVLIDEQFNILERECLTIDPGHKFKLTGREHESDIQLAFPEEVYYSSPKFDFYYDRIKALLTMKECQIIGFSLSNDTGFLATACELFGKEPIPFTYYDFQKLYQGYTKAKNRPSVEGIVKELEIIGIRLHKSDNDAYAVIKALQIIGEREKLTLPETLEMLKQKNKSYKAEKAREHNLSLIEKINSGNSKAQREFLKNFIHSLKVSEEKKEDIFFGKIVCISSHFQAKRFNEFLAIIRRVYEYGATYTGKASVCDIFIEYQDGEKEDVRMESIKQVIEKEEKEIKILSFAEAVSLLGLTEKDLNKVDYINCKLYTERKTRKYQKSQTYIDKNEKPTTVGDVLRLQGVDISKFLSED